ncbi:hypothetical protein ACJMK2_042706, partial [Sinanodonta woodiana]
LFGASAFGAAAATTTFSISLLKINQRCLDYIAHTLCDHITNPHACDTNSGSRDWRYVVRMGLPTSLINLGIFSLLAVWIPPLFSTKVKCPGQTDIPCDCLLDTKTLISANWKFVIDCASRNLTYIPDMHIPEGVKVHELLLQNNTIVKLSHPFLKRKILIEMIDISSNPFDKRELVPGSFETVGLYVKKLNLRNIGISLSAPILFLYGLGSLEHLDLSGNGNWFLTLPKDFLFDQGLVSLRTLILKSCKILKIETGAFNGLRSLEELDLSYNYLTEVPHALSNIRTLRVLNLQNNDLMSIHSNAFSSLRCLEELDLSGNLLGQIDSVEKGAFNGLTALRKLSVADCGLTSLPISEMSGFSNLQHLNISRNPLILNSIAFTGLEGLTHLSIEGVGIDHFNRLPLLGLKRLYFLDISHNNITEIKNDSFKGWMARWIILRGNFIRNIHPKAFAALQLPVKFDFSENMITSPQFILDVPKCTFYYMNIHNNFINCDCTVEKLVHSRLVQRLDADCKLDNGTLVSVHDLKVMGSLTEECGRTEVTYCDWWLLSKAERFSSILTLYFVISISFAVLRFI